MLTLSLDLMVLNKTGGKCIKNLIRHHSLTR